MALEFLLKDEELGTHFNGFRTEEERLLLLRKSTGYGRTTIPKFSKILLALFI